MMNVELQEWRDLLWQKESQWPKYDRVNGQRLHIVGQLTAPIPELAPVTRTVLPSKRDALNTIAAQEVT